MAARLIVAVVSLSIALLATAEVQHVGDRAVFGVLQRADPTQSETRVVHRAAVTESLDLVIAIGTPRHWELGPPQDFVWWGAERKLGLFLQERSDPAKVYTLAIEAGPPECAATILRATATDTVIDCRGEKSEHYPNRKFVYDVRAKALVRSFEYRPVSMSRVVPAAGGQTAVVVGAGALVGDQEGPRVAVEFVPDRVPPFRILGGGEEERWVRLHRNLLLPVTETERFGGGAFEVTPANSAEFSVESVIVERRGTVKKAHALPATSYQAFATARPRRVKDGFDREYTILEGYVGPWQVEGDRLWFGKTFYDGEAHSGVGGFGHFDAVERRFRLFAAPETADWSVSAILVQPDAIWLALVSRGEGADQNGGLVRFDRQTEMYQRHESSDVARSLARVGDQVIAATDNGITIIPTSGPAHHYIVDQTSDGRWRIAPAAR